MRFKAPVFRTRHYLSNPSDIFRFWRIGRRGTRHGPSHGLSITKAVEGQPYGDPTRSPIGSRKGPRLVGCLADVCEDED
jgi:hypothetical protein